MATSPDRFELHDIIEPIVYEQRLDAVGTTMDLSPIAAKDLLFPSQPATPKSYIAEKRYEAVTPTPERPAIKLKDDIKPP